MANIFRGATQAPIFKRKFVGSEVVPNILLGLAALLTPLGNQPFSQHDWPNPVRVRPAQIESSRSTPLTTTVFRSGRRQRAVTDPAPANGASGAATFGLGGGLGNGIGSSMGFPMVFSAATVAGNTLVAFQEIAAVGGTRVQALADTVGNTYTAVQTLLNTTNGLHSRAYVCTNALSIGDGDRGAATGGSGTTIVDSSKSWKTNQWAGRRVCNYSGASNVGTVVSNTATTLTVTGLGATVSGNYYVIGDWISFQYTQSDDYWGGFVDEIQGVIAGSGAYINSNSAQGNFSAGTNNLSTGSQNWGTNPCYLWATALNDVDGGSTPYVPLVGTGTGDGNLLSFDLGQPLLTTSHQSLTSPGTTDAKFSAQNADHFQMFIVGLADIGGGGPPTSPPFVPIDFPTPSRVRPALIETTAFTSPLLRPIVATRPFTPIEWPTPLKRRPALIETTAFLPPQYRPAVVAPPVISEDLPTPIRARSLPFESSLSSPFALITSVPFKAINRLPLQTHILARRQPRSNYDGQVSAPTVLLSSTIQFSSNFVFANGSDPYIHQAFADTYGPQPPQPLPPLTSAEYTVGTHQAAIANEHSRGEIWSRVPTLVSGAATPLGPIEQTIETRDPSDPNASWVRGPYTSFLVAHNPLLGPVQIAPSQQWEGIDVVNANASSAFGPQPPTGPKRPSEFVSGAPQQVDFPQGYAHVYLLPQPPGAGQTVGEYWESDQDWPEYRPSSIDTSYGPLFVHKPTPLFGLQVQGASRDPELLQPNSSDIYGQQPPTAITVPLGPVPPAAPQQTDQGYGLVSSFGWAAFPPGSIAPDKPATPQIPQAAPLHQDYLEANKSRIRGQQPPTATKAPINRTAWTDPDQKTVASQQSYGALFGARKPPNFFINVKMVPGEDDPEQPAGSPGHGLLWSVSPPSSISPQISFEFQFGTHQKNEADAVSRGYIVPRAPNTASSTPLGPSVFAAPQQSDEGRASIFKKPPPSAQRPSLAPFIFAQRVEDLDNESLITSEPLVAPPPAAPLGPSFYASHSEVLDQPGPVIFRQPLATVFVPATVVSMFVAEPDPFDPSAYGRVWGQMPPSSGSAYIPLEFFADQDIPIQGVSAIFSAHQFPTTFRPKFIFTAQEVQDNNQSGQVANNAEFTTPQLQFPPFGTTLFAPAELPDQSNVGRASLSKPFLPLPAPALGPAISSAQTQGDIAAHDTAGGNASISGPIPGSGGPTPLASAIFSAPDQRNQADEPSGGSIRGVWQRNVPTQLTAPHMLPLGFALMRLGGIQMN